MRRRRLSGGWNPRVERRGFRVAWGTVAALLLVGSIGLGILHNRLQAQKKMDPVQAGAQLVTVPAQLAAARTRQTVGSTWRGLFGGLALESENQQLKAELSVLRIEHERRLALESENIRLRQLLSFPAAGTRKPMAAEVIAWLPSSLEESITVARGSRDGVVRDQVVRTAEGLLGKVTEVGPFSAKVRLLTDKVSGVGATVEKGKAFGILRGVEEQVGGLSHRHVLELVHLDRSAPIAVGDTVETSGQGGIFPPGIPIGTIESLSEDKSHLLKIARIKPFSPMPGLVREVLLLPATTATEPTKSLEPKRP